VGPILQQQTVRFVPLSLLQIYAKEDKEREKERETEFLRHFTSVLFEKHSLTGQTLVTHRERNTKPRV